MSKRFISWRRVSTFKQNRTGLGLSAQKEIIRYFIERDKGEWIADYEECYTGKELSGCKELRKAMEHAKRENATLIIAKSDRFRNTAEALQIYEEMGDGNIMFCDLPTSDKFSLTLFFALAEREALLVSIRTKQALAVKKAQGCKLGAGSEKYRENYNNKTKEQKNKESMERGKMKNERHLAKRETQVFLKVLRNVFPEACADEDASNWNWKGITTRGEYTEKIKSVMIDYKELDESGNLFKKWDFTWDEKYFRTRLCAHIQNIRVSVLRNKKNNNQ